MTQPPLAAAVSTEYKKLTPIERIAIETKTKDEKIRDFDKLSAEFETVYQQSNADDTFFRLSSEYQKVYKALTKSKAHFMEIFKLLEDVTREYDDTPFEAIKPADMDKHLLKTLKTQIKRAQELLEQSGKREEASKSELKQLKYDINNLTNTIKQGVGLSALQERNINDLTATKQN